MGSEQRKLAAIMFTDIQDFTRRMSEREALGLTLLRKHNEIMDSVVTKHGGTVVKNIGDAYLVDFGSAVNAVQAAIEAQNSFAQFNEEKIDDEKILVRICIHLGDVVVEGNDMFGDGVNVASRLQTLTPPGAICISRDVYHQVKSKLTFRSASLGLQELKGIPEPIEVFQIFTPLVSERSMPPVVTTPSKPNGELSIAVLPFANWSEDKDNEYFSDGISEDIITDLAKIPSLRVTSRNSAFTYKGKNVDVMKIGKELNVRYVLEGSVRKAGNRLRITAQLIDTSNNFHLWAERFDKELKDIFEIQDEISQKIADELKIRLTNEERQAITHKATQNLHAYELYLKGLYHSRKRTTRDSDLAIDYLRKALDLDPRFETAHAALAFELRFRHSFGFERNPSLLHEAKHHAEKALAINPVSADGLLIKALILREEGYLKEAIEVLRRLLELCPSHVLCLSYLGTACRDAGYYDKACEYHIRAFELEPTDFYHVYNLWVDYWQNRMPDKSAECIDKMRILSPDHFLVVMVNAMEVGLQGHQEEMETLFARAIELDVHHIDTYAVRGNMRRLFDKLQEAYEDYQYVLDRMPDNQFAIVYALPLVANLRKFEETKRLAEIEIKRSAAILMFGIDAKAMGYLYHGIACRFLGQSRDSQASLHMAQETIERHLREFPESPPLLALQGLILGSLGEFEKAVSSVEHAMRIAPQNDDYAFTLSRVYALQGNKKHALQYLRRSFALGKREFAMIKTDVFFEKFREDSDFLGLIVQARNNMV